MLTQSCYVSCARCAFYPLFLCELLSMFSYVMCIYYCIYLRCVIVCMSRTRNVYRRARAIAHYAVLHVLVVRISTYIYLLQNRCNHGVPIDMPISIQIQSASNISTPNYILAINFLESVLSSRTAKKTLF